jgi:5-methylcytosine-specific restriction endonuclease McrBC GTP-binding regulatory subunit McrB
MLQWSSDASNKTNKQQATLQIVNPIRILFNSTFLNLFTMKLRISVTNILYSTLENKYKWLNWFCWFSETLDFREQLFKDFLSNNFIILNEGQLLYLVLLPNKNSYLIKATFKFICTSRRIFTVPLHTEIEYSNSILNHRALIRGRANGLGKEAGV